MTNVSSLNATHYNVTNIGSTRNIVDFVSAVNTEVDGFLSYGIIIGFFAVMFISFKAYGWSSKAAFSVTSFISAILCTFMFVAGFAHETVMLASIVLAAAGVVSLVFDTNFVGGV